MKRSDLQGLRGLAIIIVVLFHLRPDKFRLGFVGVDMFFVLSGYLMSSILSKELPLSHSRLVEFYKRRFKRIVPIFYLIALLTYAGCWFLLMNSDRKQLKKDILWAISFTSNIQPNFEAKGYWDQISSYRFFVHCWSLGVEIQYYLIAPFILSVHGASKVKAIAFLTFLSILSLFCQTISTPSVAYGFLSSRMWQFLCGSIAFEKTRDRQQPQDLPLDKSILRNLPYSARFLVRDVIVSSIVVIVIVDPQIITETTMRLLTTMAIAILIAVSVPTVSSPLCDPYLVRVGDASYSLYLIHWPIIVASKYYLNQHSLEFLDCCILVLLLCLAAYFVNISIERYLCSCEFRVSLSISAISVLLILGTIRYYDSEPTRVLSNSSGKEGLREVIDWNIRESQKDYFRLPCSRDSVTEKWTNYSEEEQLRCQTNGNGSATILVLGNSIAYRAFPLIHSILQGRFKTLRLYSRSGCAPLSNQCPPFTAAARIVIDRIRPDIIFSIYDNTEKDFLDPFTEEKVDPTIRAMQQNLYYYSARSKHIVLDMPYYVHRTIRVGYEVGKRLERGLSLEDLKVDRQTDQMQQGFHRARLQALSCFNCIFNEIHEALFDGDFYYLYNRTSCRAYTGDGAHFTPEGLALIRPYYERIVETLLEKLNT